MRKGYLHGVSYQRIRLQIQRNYIFSHWLLKGSVWLETLSKFSSLQVAAV